MIEFEPPPFRPHPLLRGGHLQTLASLRHPPRWQSESERHVVELSDGDAIVLHEDRPPGWRPDDPSVLLVHGLCGCHAAGYMVRFAARLHRRGTRVFRMDCRGCGAATDLARELSHAGRSDDVLAALAWIARATDRGPIGAIAVSLGGNLLLRALGRVGAGAEREPEWWGRIDRAMAVAPPIDLASCAAHMRRPVMLPYNRYFIRMLLERTPPRVRQREAFQAALRMPRPRTLWELDERFTAPLSGFSGAEDYYDQSSAARWLADNRVPTLILAAEDDPIVPADCFRNGATRLPPTTRLLLAPRGGHVGFVDRSRGSWMDDVVEAWFDQRT